MTCTDVGLKKKKKKRLEAKAHQDTENPKTVTMLPQMLAGVRSWQNVCTLWEGKANIVVAGE